MLSRHCGVGKTWNLSFHTHEDTIIFLMNISQYINNLHIDFLAVYNKPTPGKKQLTIDRRDLFGKKSKITRGRENMNEKKEKHFCAQVHRVLYKHEEDRNVCRLLKL